MCGEVYNKIFFMVELICVVIFIVEFLIWFYVCLKKKKFMLDVMNVIDILVILFYYIMLVVISFGVEMSFF